MTTSIPTESIGGDRSPLCLEKNTGATYKEALAHLSSGLSKASAAQMATATNRFLEAIGKSLESPIGNEFFEAHEESLRALYSHLRSRGGAEATYSSVASRVGSLRAAALGLIADKSLPVDFAAALVAAIERSPYSKGDVDLRFGGIVLRWRLGTSVPAERSIPKLRELEEFLGIPGNLLSRLPHLIRRRWTVGELDSADGLPKTFGQCLRRLRQAKGMTFQDLTLRTLAAGQSIGNGSICRWEIGLALPLKVKRTVIEEIEKSLGVAGPLIKRYDSIAASTSPYSPTTWTSKPYAYWNDALKMEFEHLAWFKSIPELPEGLKRNSEGQWTREASKVITEKNYSLFFGYCQLPSDHQDPMLRGAGLARGNLGFALLLNYSLLVQFCDFRRNRGGKSYNAGTISFIAAIRNLVHPITGYFTQFSNRFCHHPLLQGILPSEVKVTVLGKEEIRPLADPRQRFVALCGQVYEKTSDFLKRLTIGGEAKQTRDPTRRIKKILAEDQPLDPLLMLRERMETFMPGRNQRYKRARHITNIALVAVMNIKPLRVFTLSALKKSEIYRNDHDGSWHAAVPKEHFKNAKFGARNGWFGEIHKSAWPALDIYWDEARPFLTFATECDRFWVNSNGSILADGSIHTSFLAFTKQFIPEFAPEGINPHAWRKVVSNDNFKTDRLNAVTKSAQQLNDLPKTVMKSYAMDTDQLRNDWVNGHTDARLSRRKS